MRSCLCCTTLHPISQPLLADVTEVVRVLLYNEHARGHFVSGATWTLHGLLCNKDVSQPSQGHKATTGTI